MSSNGEAEKFLACRLLLVSLGKPPFIARLSRDGVEKLEDKKRDGIHEVEHPCRCIGPADGPDCT